MCAAAPLWPEWPQFGRILGLTAGSRGQQCLASSLSDMALPAFGAVVVKMVTGTRDSRPQQMWNL